MSATPPAVTIITAVYNYEAFIAQTIRSVQAQTFADFEYLIIDDGSTDGTCAAARSAAAGDSRIRLIARAHLGSGAARNQGLADARGEYISFIDGDDLWEPRFLSAMLAALQRNDDVAGVFCWSRFIDEAGRPLRRFGLAGRPAPRRYDARGMLEGLCPSGNGSCLVIRKRCFDEAGTFDEQLTSWIDAEMWVRIAQRSSRPCFIALPETLVSYRLHGKSISRSLGAQRYETLARLFEDHTRELAPAEVPQAVICFAAHVFLRIEDPRADKWLRLASKASLFVLLRRPDGWVVLLWRWLGAELTRKLFAVGKRLYGERTEVAAAPPHSAAADSRAR